MTSATKRYVVSGRVQGVGFRYFVRTQAKKMNVRGWVRNLSDGRVEAVATADPEILGIFESSLRSGPPLSAVDGVEVSDEAAADFPSFEVKP